MDPTCDYEKHPSPCACCDWRLRVELPDLRAALNAIRRAIAPLALSQERLDDAVAVVVARLQAVEGETAELRRQLLAEQSTLAAKDAEIEHDRAENERLRETVSMTGKFLISIGEWDGAGHPLNRAAELYSEVESTLPVTAQPTEEKRHG